MNQKTTMKVTQKILAGAGVVALTVGFLIANPPKSADEKLMSECLQQYPTAWQAEPRWKEGCSIEVAHKTGKITAQERDKRDHARFLKYTPKEFLKPVVEAPAASTPEPVAVAPVEHTNTYEETMTEACEAGRQYKNDVATGFMTHSQSFAKAREYAHHLSAQSAGVDSGEIYAKIKECLW